MPDWIPKPDVQFQASMETLVTRLEADEAAYGIVAADSLALRNALSAFNNALVAADTAKAAANTAVANKDAARVALEALVRPLVARIQVNPVVTDANRQLAGIPIRDTIRTFSAPTPPQNLIATADASGVTTLKWDAGANAAGVQYVVEARIGNATEFSRVDVVTARTYRHTGVTVGQHAEYRVRARRGTAESGPSNTASVY